MVFVLKNTDTIAHEFVVEGFGEVESILPGQEARLTLVADEVGEFAIVCEKKVDDGRSHADHGMKGVLVVR